MSSIVSFSTTAVHQRHGVAFAAALLHVVELPERVDRVAAGKAGNVAEALEARSVADAAGDGLAVAAGGEPLAVGDAAWRHVSDEIGFRVAALRTFGAVRNQDDAAADRFVAALRAARSACRRRRQSSSARSGPRPPSAANAASATRSIPPTSGFLRRSSPWRCRSWWRRGCRRDCRSCIPPSRGWCSAPAGRPCWRIQDDRRRSAGGRARRRARPVAGRWRRTPASADVRPGTSPAD